MDNPDEGKTDTARDELHDWLIRNDQSFAIGLRACRHLVKRLKRPASLDHTQEIALVKTLLRSLEGCQRSLATRLKALQHRSIQK